MYESPLVEKYRPSKLDTTVLLNQNKLIFKHILNRNIFPNVLLYGPPGTGKTTTIINIVNDYLKHRFFSFVSCRIFSAILINNSSITF